MLTDVDREKERKSDHDHLGDLRRSINPGSCILVSAARKIEKKYNTIIVIVNNLFLRIRISILKILALNFVLFANSNENKNLKNQICSIYYL